MRFDVTDCSIQVNTVQWVGTYGLSDGNDDNNDDHDDDDVDDVNGDDGLFLKDNYTENCLPLFSYCVLFVIFVVLILYQ